MIVRHVSDRSRPAQDHEDNTMYYNNQRMRLSGGGYSGPGFSRRYFTLQGGPRGKPCLPGPAPGFRTSLQSRVVPRSRGTRPGPGSSWEYKY